MPTNLPAEYYDAEERYRAAQTPEEKVQRLEEMLSTIPKHKGTDHLRADLRRKLSQLKEAAKTQKKTTGRRESVYHIDREGAGQVAVLGAPNVGKSALVDALTNAEPEVAIHPYSTWEPTPGMMQVDNVQIQLIDTPPLSREYIEPQMMDLIRRADLILLLVDLQAFPIEQLEDTITLLEEQNIIPLQRLDRYDEQQRIRYTFRPVLVVANKTDDESLDEDFAVLGELLDDEWTLVPVSAGSGRGLDRLRWAVFDTLNLMRVYSKPPNRDADLSAPFVLRRGSTVAEFAEKVHRDFREKLKSARIWGTGVYDGQMVGRDHVLHDEDVVELRI